MKPRTPTPATRARRSGRLADPVMRAVLALGITQITAWGTSYYCLGVLAAPISQDTGWSRGFVFLGFTVALLAMALVSSAAGRAIDRHGGRAVMTLGTVLISAGLFALAHVRREPVYLAVWAFLGVGMRLSLYDAAFAALVQVDPARGRKAISYVTLFGAFASSVFWVVGHALDQQVGWRQTLVLFALINLVVCLPLHWLGLGRRDAAAAGPGPAESSQTSEPSPLEGRARSVAIVLFALVMSLSGCVFSVVSVQLVSLLEAAGLATAVAVWVASMKGAAQFGGRVVEIVFARNLQAITVGRIAVGLLPVSLLLLLTGAGNLSLVVAFTLLMGGCQGVLTIVRGAVPLAMFGARGYGAVLGVIAAPISVVNAAAPTAFAWIVDRWGWPAARVALLAGAAAAWLVMEAMARWYERQGRRVGGRQAARSSG
ncbi:MAG TPA: MFS transporter [Methylomirabilota bacterium]|nr:MFS transporter [Methylomirabilota bacterium]